MIVRMKSEADWKLLINRRRRGRTASTPGIDDELGPLPFHPLQQRLGVNNDVLQSLPPVSNEIYT